MSARVKNLASGIVLATFAVLALASGGKKTDKDGKGGTTAAATGGKKVVASCDLINSTGTCEDHHKDGFFLDIEKTGCAEIVKIHNTSKGWSTTTPCPQKDIVGTCVADTDGDSATEYFYAPMHTQKTAEETCKGKINKSKFTAMGTPAEPSSPRISCTKAGADLCEQWNASSTESWEAINSSCTFVFDKEKAQISPGKACSTDGAYAKCERPNGTTQVFYKKSGIAFDKRLCKERPGDVPGTWVDLSGKPAAKPATTTAAKNGASTKASASAKK